MAQTSCIRQALLLTILAVLTIAWEAEWLHGVQPENQDNFVDLNVLEKWRRAEAEKGFTIKASLPWYKPADLMNPRLEPSCRLRVAHFKAGQGAVLTCTCAFVKPDLVITAAHCLYNAQVTPNSEHAIFVQQLYGKGNVKDFYKYTRNMVLEWWYPAAFSGTNDVLHDVAFLKTKDKVTTHYNLMREIDLASQVRYNVESEKVWMLGYPDDAASSEVAVLGSGIMTTLNKEGTVVENSFQPTDESQHPVMNQGSSGGPIIMAEETLTKFKTKKWDNVAEAVKMGLFGVVGKGVGEKPFNKNLAFKMTEKLIKVANRFDNQGSAGIKDAEIKKRDNGVELVTLKGI